ACVTIGGWSSASLVTAAGIVLSDTNTTNTGSQTAVAIGNASDSHVHRVIHKWSAFGETASGALAADNGICRPTTFLRLRRQAGVYSMGWSDDGLAWYDQVNVLLGAITPAYFGVYAQSYSSTELQVNIDY